MKLLIIILLAVVGSHALASANCHETYWGTKAEPDYKTAYQCFEKSKNLSFLALMNFNGQGVSQNPAKAFEIAQQACSACPNCDGDVGMLLQLIDERTDEVKSKPVQIVFKEIALTTLDMNLFSDYQSERTTYETRKEFESLKTGLSLPTRQALDHLLQSFDKFANAEAQWRTGGYRGGSIRGQMTNNEKAALMTEFKNRIKIDISVGKIDTRTSADFKKADLLLNETYQKQLNSLDPKTKAEDQKELKLAQRQWVQLRDRWIAFQIEKLKEKQSPSEIEISQKTWLTEARIRDFQKNPGCESPQTRTGSCPPLKSAFPAGESAQDLFNQASKKFGNPLHPNCKAALPLLKKSAEMGLLAAMNRYGYCLEKGGAPAEGMTWYKKAADAGNFKARANYIRGLTDQGEKEKATTQWRELAKAAAMDPEAHYFLYYTDPSNPESMVHLKKAADDGLDVAQLQMALVSLNPQLPLAQQDPIKVREAQRWASKAARQGLKNETFLRWLYSCPPSSNGLMPKIQSRSFLPSRSNTSVLQFIRASAAADGITIE